MEMSRVIHQASISRLRGACPWTVTINNQVWGIFSTERAAVLYLGAVTNLDVRNLLRGLET